MKEAYFLSIANGVEGPFSISQIREMLKAGEVDSETLYAYDGAERWAPLKLLQSVWQRAPMAEGVGANRAQLKEEINWPIRAAIILIVFLVVIGLFIVLQPDSGPLGVVIAILVGLPIYFIPAFVASSRKHPNAVAITALNLLLGWTFIGWAAALVWALCKSPSKSG